MVRSGKHGEDPAPGPLFTALFPPNVIGGQPSVALLFSVSALATSFFRSFRRTQEGNVRVIPSAAKLRHVRQPRSALGGGLCCSILSAVRRTVSVVLAFFHQRRVVVLLVTFRIGALNAGFFPGVERASPLKNCPHDLPPASPCPSAPRRLHASSVFTLPFLRLSSRLLSNHEARGGAQDDAAGEGRQGEQSCTLRVTREQFHDGSRGLFRPHPFNRRFARVRKPVFPIEARNLRLMYKRKPKRRRGRGDKSNAKGIRWKHVHQQAGRYKGPRSRTFEGGKNPLYKRIPKWPDAWLARQRRVLEPLNLAKIRTFIESGRLDTRFTITQRHLHDSRCVKVKNGVKLFNVNDYPFPYKISIEVAGADQSSIDAIRRVGGEVIIVYRNRLNLRAHIKPYKFEVLPRTARPNLEMLHYLEKMRARGCVVKYVKPQWLIDEERSLKTELAEFEAEALIAKGEAVDRSAPDLRESVDDLQERLLKRFRLRETLAAELTRQQEAEEAERKAKQNDGERAD
ncbi:putative ribosomal protein L15 [Besnoitia besnoiti]|uniref:Putative ribosomal protein L15 n=1 Tax=Besnoitia besnoiti TaxID=94643 RepID=A0A2A9MBD5_BESBE|nr:putative ribosomal protein L15 [Besnoitia besnoiti]PFH32700.1 putative ribosomal protein L15 [Besnoitia besnoiti]